MLLLELEELLELLELRGLLKDVGGSSWKLRGRVCRGKAGRNTERVNSCCERDGPLG